MANERKGYSKRSDIPQSLLDQLNRGEVETKTLAEGLAVDFCCLLATLEPRLVPLFEAERTPKTGVKAKMEIVGRLLYSHFGVQHLSQLQQSKSDTVRGWACYLQANDARCTLKTLLKRIRPFADDPHFGVREWAWMAVRPRITQELDASLLLLQSWVVDDSPAVRRFASEVTRPCGVWCTHIQMLKDNPSLAEPLLEPLHNDPEKYVQDSVANWLNDAGKYQPAWVKALTTRWQKKSKTPHTKRICERGLRNL